MRKRGLPGLGIFLVGLFVSLVSFMLGSKFVLFLLVGIGFVFYGLTSLFILKDKTPERIAKEEHDAKVTLHHLSHPPSPPAINYCAYCRAPLYQNAELCTRCGSWV